MLEREGAQIGSLQWALVKLTPLDARRSKLGVGTSGLPAGCSGISLRSSTMMNKTFGLVVGSCPNATIVAEHTQQAIVKISGNCRCFTDKIHLQFATCIGCANKMLSRFRYAATLIQIPCSICYLANGLCFEVS